MRYCFGVISVLTNGFVPSAVELGNGLDCIASKRVGIILIGALGFAGCTVILICNRPIVAKPFRDWGLVTRSQSTSSRPVGASAVPFNAALFSAVSNVAR